jgi:hypothetical protein
MPAHKGAGCFEALDWVPGPEMNSLAVLVMHFTGSERYWVSDVVAGVPSFRNREAEFQAKGLDAAALKQRLSDLDAFEAAAFEKLRVRDLEAHKIASATGCNVTVVPALPYASSIPRGASAE